MKIRNLGENWTQFGWDCIEYSNKLYNILKVIKYWVRAQFSSTYESGWGIPIWQTFIVSFLIISSKWYPSLFDSQILDLYSDSLFIYNLDMLLMKEYEKVASMPLHFVAS